MGILEDREFRCPFPLRECERVGVATVAAVIVVTSAAWGIGAVCGNPSDWVATTWLLLLPACLLPASHCWLRVFGWVVLLRKLTYVATAVDIALTVDGA
jgi:hypothetical protein